VLALLERFYDPSRGAIRVDGVCVTQVGLAALQHTIARCGVT
jgi:ABC-type multidrug transport system fused ATPase/permease subunit